MNKANLIELADNPQFISGIYNYCDRWCERCPFTSRCFLYATEQADPDLDDPEVHDINNAKFWRKLEQIFKQTHEMIADWAREAGVDLEAIDVEETLAEREQLRNEAKGHELSLSARRYAEMVQEWFKDEFAVEQNVHNDAAPEALEEDVNVTDAVDVIHWYQFFIAAKLYRGLMGREGDMERGSQPTPGSQRPSAAGVGAGQLDWGTVREGAADEIFPGPEPDEDEEYDAELEAVQNDSNGSVKVALIAIDRSLSAWRILQTSLPEKADTIVPMLVELERLRHATEAYFPNARDFIRPGFDEVNTEFAS